MGKGGERTVTVIYYLLALRAMLKRGWRCKCVRMFEVNLAFLGMTETTMLDIITFVLSPIV